MANQIALKLHSRPGDVLVADRFAHVVIYEYGGAAAHAGLMIDPLDGRDGRFTVEQLEAVTAALSSRAPSRCVASPRPRAWPQRGSAGSSTR